MAPNQANVDAPTFEHSLRFEPRFCSSRTWMRWDRTPGPRFESATDTSRYPSSAQLPSRRPHANPATTNRASYGHSGERKHGRRKVGQFPSPDGAIDQNPKASESEVNCDSRVSIGHFTIAPLVQGDYAYLRQKPQPSHPSDPGLGSIGGPGSARAHRVSRQPIRVTLTDDCGPALSQIIRLRTLTQRVDRMLEDAAGRQRKIVLGTSSEHERHVGRTLDLSRRTPWDIEDFVHCKPR